MKTHRAFALHRTELPTARAIAWNIASILFAIVAFSVARHVGHLDVFLAALAAMVAATAVQIARITQRTQREADERVAAFHATRSIEPAPAPAAVPADALLGRAA